MQIKISVDATPEEMRRFFGLPDVAPLQEEMIQRIQEKIRAGDEGFDPVTLMQTYLVPNVGTLEAMQKAFWESLSAASGGKSSEK